MNEIFTGLYKTYISLADFDTHASNARGIYMPINIHTSCGKGGTGWLERDITTVMVVGSRVYLFHVKELNLD